MVKGHLRWFLHNERGRRSSLQTGMQGPVWGRRQWAVDIFPVSASVSAHSIQEGWIYTLEVVLLFFHREQPPYCKPEKESTVKIFEQSIQTPCGSYWRQAAREQLLRMGNEDMAKTRRQFTVIFFLCFFVMGCQNGFDLLRDLLIINCIICFLLRSGQEKQTRTHHQRPGQISYHQRAWLDRSWRSRLSADGV